MLSLATFRFNFQIEIDLLTRCNALLNSKCECIEISMHFLPKNSLSVHNDDSQLTLIKKIGRRPNGHEMDKLRTMCVCLIAHEHA